MRDYDGRFAALLPFVN